MPKKEKEKKITYREATHLELMLDFYRHGFDFLPQSHCEISNTSIASEITGKYRARDGCLQTKSGVSMDGPLCEDIEAAILSAMRYGAVKEHYQGARLGSHRTDCRTCNELGVFEAVAGFDRLDAMKVIEVTTEPEIKPIEPEPEENTGSIQEKLF